MKVAVIFLNYGERTQYTDNVLASINQAGYHFDFTMVDRKGIAAAINYGLAKNPDYDAYAIIANDIKLPPNWLREMVKYAEIIPNTGIVGIHCVEWMPDKDHNGVHPTWCPFGDWLVMRSVVNLIGGFNTAHDPYGMQDSDYGYRATKAGFFNYYIPDMRSEHVGSDVGNGTEYRKMKDEGLSKALDTYNHWVNHYTITNNLYLPITWEQDGQGT
jgi:GT2 family glycosyltransferase